MKFFLAVLSLYLIIQKCYSLECILIPPGIDRLSHGVDITSFDIFPPDLTKPNGFARTIFDWTCDKKKKWQNPYTNQVYDLPDQIESITVLPGGVQQNIVEVHNNYHEIQKSRSMSLGLGLVGGMFGFSYSSSKYMQKITAEEKTITTVTAQVSALAAQMIPSYAEHAGTYMKQFYDQFLPNNYLENPGKYQEFLNTFGTHWFQNGQFGGKMVLEIQTNKAYAMTTNSKSLGVSASATFFNILTLSGGHKKGLTKVDKHYYENSVFTASYYGGVAELITTGGLQGFDGWAASVHKSPWIFGGQMKSIVEFLPNGPKKNAVNTAVTVKMDYAYLEEMVRNINILKQNPYIDMAGANNYINQANALRGQVIPPHDRVAQLGAAIDGFIGANKGKTAPKPPCAVKYDSKAKKNVCVNPATCVCNIK